MGQYHGNILAGTWQDHHGNISMTRAWQEQGNNHITWQEHGNNLARAWQEHGKIMVRPWQEHGKSTAST
jgi:6-phosphogluconolactonase (cycloisomerase 2 family)